ncbi:MAG TPA: DoxX family protein [Gemmatimonadales bacterium]|nr:DoxX family protein [Gemmatimonadales bacterium]
MAIDELAARWAPRLLSVLRIVAAFMFMTHGTQKLFGVPALEPKPPAELFSLFGVAGVLETFGGLLLLLGLFTRPVAFLLSGEMAVAYFMFHWPKSFWPILNRGEHVVLFCFLYLYLAAAGGGEWALDRVLARRRP